MGTRSSWPEAARISPATVGVRATYASVRTSTVTVLVHGARDGRNRAARPAFSVPGTARSPGSGDGRLRCARREGQAVSRESLALAPFLDAVASGYDAEGDGFDPESRCWGQLVGVDPSSLR